MIVEFEKLATDGGRIVAGRSSQCYWDTTRRKRVLTQSNHLCYSYR